MFVIDESQVYYTDITSKKKGDGYHSFLKASTSFDSNGDVYTVFLVVSNNKGNVDTKSFTKLLDAIDLYNSIR